MLIFLVRTDMMTEELFYAGYNKIDKNRKQKTDKKRFYRDKCNCVAAGLLLNYAVKIYCEDKKCCERISMEKYEKKHISDMLSYVDINKLITFYDPAYDYNIIAGDNGKPYFVHIGQDNIYFNLTHSGDYAACVIGDKENGIDIEGARKNVLKTAKRFFSNDEYEWIAGNDNEEGLQLKRFLQIWTLKEAYSKVTGIGIANGIDKVHFTIQDNRLIFTKQQLNREYNVYQTIFDGYVLSVMEKNSEEQNGN